MPVSRASKPVSLWQSTPDLIGLQLTLVPDGSHQLPSNYTYWLHAWFLNQIHQINPDISAYLHDNQTEKAFTLSPFFPQPHDLDTFWGDTLGQDPVTFLPTKTYICQITALCAPVCNALQQWLMKPPRQISLQGRVFQIQGWQLSQPATTYEDLWNNALPDHLHRQPLSLTFLTPTSFRQQGHHLPLPVPENLFHSYLRRWNQFAHLECEPLEFLAWVRQQVLLHRHQIHSHTVKVAKLGAVTGFVGTIQLGLTAKAKQEPDYLQLIGALLRAAPYFGTGHKVTFGLGQTRLGVPWTGKGLVSVQAEPVNKPSDSANDSGNVQQLRQRYIDARIAELEPQFVASRVRQGGERAKKIARVWATVIAHQEAGDSLKDVAEILQIPYESVKSYAKLARRAMESK
jgi:CRISPR-associated endoribonuclease Cas6